MLHIQHPLSIVFLAAVLLNYSCQRELSLPQCINNQPPVAHAGKDIINLPSDTVTLDGSLSRDAQGNISNYQWTKISGPAGVVITNTTAVKTAVKNLKDGTYEFELIASDACGLFSKDTVSVNVTLSVNGTSGTPPLDSCGTDRILTNSNLIPISTLPFAAMSLFATIGNKIYFLTFECASCTNPSRVYFSIYDVVSQSWSVSRNHLTIARNQGQIVTAGNKIFYAGGYNSNDPTMSPFSNVDIYDASADTWSSASLSIGRYDMGGAVLKDKVIFAGGFRRDPNVPITVNKYIPSDVVDIYNVTMQAWSTAKLSIARAHLSVVVNSDKMYFAGGSAGSYAADGLLAPSTTIDVYDNVSGNWSVTTELAVPKTYMASIAVGNKIIWAGGLTSWEDYTQSVEIRDVNTQSSTFTCLSHKKYWNLNVTVQKNNQIVFFTGSDGSYSPNTFDIYDLTTGKWSFGILPIKISEAAVIAVNNTIFVAGGNVNGNPSRQLWKLEF